MNRELRLWQALAALPWPRRVGVGYHIFRRIYLRKPRKPIVNWVDDVRLTLDPQEQVDALWLFSPDHIDKSERQFLFEALQPGHTFVDLGAYIGTYSLLAAKKVGTSGRVIAVEPEPDTYQRLWAHIQDNQLPQVIPIQRAIAASAGEALLGGGEPGNRDGRRLFAAQGCSVVTQPLLSLLQDLGVSRIDALKSDIEGQEPDVFRQFFEAAPRSLWPQRMILEMDPGDPTLLAVLKARGYEVFRLSRLNIAARLVDPSHA